MDELELVFAASTCSSLSPASFSIAGQHYQDLDFVPSEVLEQWWGIDDCCLYDEPLLDGAAWADELSGQPPPAPTAAPKKRRGRKPGLALTHVEAERQRRDKLNRRFCELRAAVPTVSRMDKASLLADAAAYIAELRGRVEALEVEAKRAAAAAFASTVAPPAGVVEEKLEVRMVGHEAAALRQTTAARHATARLMAALRSLDLAVQHACVCRVGGGVTVQDAVVDVPAGDVPAGLRDDRGLRAALLHKLQQSRPDIPSQGRS
ncbi:unnamed protein product [Urochloa humidicola]